MFTRSQETVVKCQERRVIFPLNNNNNSNGCPKKQRSIGVVEPRVVVAPQVTKRPAPKALASGESSNSNN